MKQVLKAICMTTALTLATQSAAKVNLPSTVTGDWEIVNAQSPQDSQSCDKAQRFSVSNDAREIVLTEPWSDFSARYLIVWVEPDRMLTVIEGEKRKNEKGDPIMWWFYFGDNDTFQFRQYDWLADQATSAVWKRCPSKKCEPWAVDASDNWRITFGWDGAVSS